MSFVAKLERARQALEAGLARAEALVAETGARAQTPFLIAAGHAARLATELAVAEEG